jgi:zinc/manganese transport system substrate-binding protein
VRTNIEIQTFLKALALTIAVSLAPSAAGAFNVFACEPEWASLTTELGGDLVSVYQASTALQDPHRIEARPSLIARMRQADLVVCTGADLEVGWLPVLLRSSGNRNVQPPSDRFIAAAEEVKRLEVPTVVDRAEGDIHPFGNPHVHLDPHNIATIASVITARLARLAPDHAEQFTALGDAFQTRWDAAIERWTTQAATLRGMRIVPYHKDTVYLSNWLGMVEIMNVEPKPGLPPTSAHLAELVTHLTVDSADAITRSMYQDPKPAAWLSDHTGLPVVALPYTVGGSDDARDLFTLFDSTIHRLLAAKAQHGTR